MYEIHIHINLMADSEINNVTIIMQYIHSNVLSMPKTERRQFDGKTKVALMSLAQEINNITGNLRN